MENSSIRKPIREHIRTIRACDDLESDHIKEACEWIDSGAEIFRIQRHATPPKHLVSYSAIVDIAEKRLLLFNNKKCNLFLPCWGHVDINEMPFEAAKRELKEELWLTLSAIRANPAFITITETIGMGDQNHIDVSLWYLFEWDNGKSIDQENSDFAREFNGFEWLSFNEILSQPIEKFDKHMHRFVGKLEHLIEPRK